MKNKLHLKIGVILMIICAVIYSIALIIPFLKIATSFKLVAVPIMIIVGEVAFWGGAFFLGKELVKKYKSYLNPGRWFRKRSNDHGKGESETTL